MDIPNSFYRISAKALILDENKRFLLTKEDNGLRELPGGGLDFGENPQEGIERELFEEMGINVRRVGKNPAYFVTCKNAKGFWIANIIYIVEVNIDDVYKFTPSDECQEVRFFTKEEALKEQLLPNVAEFINQYNSDNHKN